ncbi:hypothetical protein LY78DRAFT_656247, partial [Colletotrichum sublineola]
MTFFFSFFLFFSLLLPLMVCAVQCICRICGRHSPNCRVQPALMPSGSYPCWQPCPPDDEDDDGNNDNDADSIPAPSDDGEEVAQVDWLPLPRSASSADSRGPGVGHTKATLGLGALPVGFQVSHRRTGEKREEKKNPPFS